MKSIRYNRIKIVLVEKGVSSKELAEKLHVTEGTVSSWCRNFKQPKMETLFEIARQLKVEVSDLLNSVNSIFQSKV